MCVAKNELEELLKHPDVSSSPLPIIFFANKMDVPGALTPVECSQQLELERISDRPWHIAHATSVQQLLLTWDSCWPIYCATGPVMP